MEDLWEDEENAAGSREEEVKEKKGSEEKEIGEHPRAEASAQLLHGGGPQFERAADVEAAEGEAAPHLRREKND